MRRNWGRLARLIAKGQLAKESAWAARSLASARSIAFPLASGLNSSKPLGLLEALIGNAPTNQSIAEPPDCHLPERKTWMRAASLRGQDREMQCVLSLNPYIRPKRTRSTSKRLPRSEDQMIDSGVRVQSFSFK
jgi:hypothetical protein